MRILITGITGLLGTSIYQMAEKEHDMVGIYHPKRHLQAPFNVPVFSVNVSDVIEMENIISSFKPDVIIHTAGIGNVDYTEQNKEEAYKINVVGTNNIVKICEENKIRLVYISSNAVFNGNDPLYSENDNTTPINYYGVLKVEAENLVKSSNVDWVILRPILMYGWPYPGERENHVVFWIKNLRSGKPIKVVDNVYSKPLYSRSCAEAILEIVEQNKNGIYHVAGSDHISLYEFSMITAEVFQLDRDLITPVPDSYFSELTLRPRDTSFSTEKLERDTGYKPMSVREGLLHMKTSQIK